MYTKTKKITFLAMLCAMSFVVVAFGRIPVYQFLDYEAKDVIITIGGFIFGPLYAFIISLVVSLIEMLTISDTGVIGFIMNLISSCAFACTAAFVYKRKQTKGAAIVGLLLGVVSMIAIMLLWNYLITPLYLGYSREAVAKLLIPIFLPFNALKGALNAAITFLMYKPIVTALRKVNLIPESSQTETKKFNIGTALISLIIIATGVLLICVMNGKL